MLLMFVVFAVCFSGSFHRLVVDGVEVVAEEAGIAAIVWWLDDDSLFFEDVAFLVPGSVGINISHEKIPEDS